MIRGLPFVKVSATGNDFLLLRGPLGGLEADMARRLCDRRRSVGADGLAIVTRCRDGTLRVVHREPDGARTWCLNALRGVAAWALRAGRWDGREPLRLLTDAGPVAVRRRGLAFEVELPPPRSIGERRLELEGRSIAATFVDVGNPQLVVLLHDEAAFEADELMALGRALRWHPDIAGGTNVDFVLDGDQPRVRTYERGVEGETLACGSGIVASACALARAAGHPAGTWRLTTRGGETQVVTLEADRGGWTRVWSAAAAEVVASGRVPLAA